MQRMLRPRSGEASGRPSQNPYFSSTKRVQTKRARAERHVREYLAACATKETLPAAVRGRRVHPAGHDRLLVEPLHVLRHVPREDVPRPRARGGARGPRRAPGAARRTGREAVRRRRRRARPADGSLAADPRARPRAASRISRRVSLLRDGAQRPREDRRRASRASRGRASRSSTSVPSRATTRRSSGSPRATTPPTTSKRRGAAHAAGMEISVIALLGIAIERSEEHARATARARHARWTRSTSPR